MRNFFAGTHRKPGFRKASRSNGFRIVGSQAQRVRRLNRSHAIPEPIAGPGTGEVAGVDRGVAVSAALSTGEML
jgi:hypothetical protein